MARGDWIRLAKQIAADLRALRTDRVVTYTLDELLRRAGGDAEPEGYRSRGYWAAEQRGGSANCGFREAGLVLAFDPDERGVPVKTVTFRPDDLRRREVDELS